MLRAVARALRPGARFVLETGIVAESLLPKLQEYFWMPVGAILFLAARRYNALESRLDIEYTFVQHGVRDTRPASSRIYQWPKSAASAQRWAWKQYRSTDRSMAGRTGWVPLV
jgi:hypothetical protein